MRSTLLAAGVIALAAAAALTLFIVPSQARFPGDVDNTSTYEGTLEVRFDTDALTRGDIAELFVRDVAVTIENHTRTLDVDGDLALVGTEGVAVDATGTPIQDSEGLYVIDRVTMLTTDDHVWQDVPSRGQGLVTGFRIGTEARDHVGWSDEIGDTVDLRYERTEERAGLETYVFTSSVTNAVVVDEDTLGLVPEALPKDVLVQLAGTLDLPETLAGQLDALIPLLPDPVPLGLTYSGEATYWVEPTTGVVIDLERTESRAAYLDVPVIPVVVPVVDVWSWSYRPTEATVADAVTTAENGAASLRLYGTTLPIALTVLGVVSLGAAALRGRRVSAEISPEPELTDAA